MDNCIVNHEMMYYMKSKTGRKGFMVVKVDMAKAYDMVEWTTLVAIPRRHGFSDNFCNWCKNVSLQHGFLYSSTILLLASLLLQEE